MQNKEAWLEFGTGGLRGLLGQGPGKMNRDTVAQATRALALVARDQGLMPAVAIGYDTRRGSRDFAETAAAVLVDAGFTVHLFGLPVPTPLVSFGVRKLGLGLGIMITASHNPPEYNGYKVYDGRGVQALPPLTQAIGAAMSDLPSAATPALPDTHPLLHLRAEEGLFPAYLEELSALLGAVDRPVRVLYSALHGSGASLVPQALAGHQLECIQCQEDPDFGGLEAPNPELPASFAKALERAQITQPELVLATDADCDRVGVLVPWAGSYQALTGNQIGALLADVLLPKDSGGRDALVTTIVSGKLAQRIAQARGCRVIRTLTGFKYIGEVAETLGQATFLGYEESYGFLTGNSARDKDAVQACALLCKLAAQGSLYQRWLDLCKIHGHDAERLLSFTLEPEGFVSRMERAMDRLRAQASTCLGEAIVRDYALGLAGLPQADVLELESPGFRVLFRPSGTEPKFKCYVSVQGESLAEAESQLDALSQRVDDLVRKALT